MSLVNDMDRLFPCTLTPFLQDQPTTGEEEEEEETCGVRGSVVRTSERCAGVTPRATAPLLAHHLPTRHLRTQHHRTPVPFTLNIYRGQVAPYSTGPVTLSPSPASPGYPAPVAQAGAQGRGTGRATIATHPAHPPT